MVGELYLYTSDEEDRLIDRISIPREGDVCMLVDPDYTDYLQTYVVLRKDTTDAWRAIFKFKAYLMDRRVGQISEQKAYHLLAGYKLRRLSFTKKKKRQKETVH